MNQYSAAVIGIIIEIIASFILALETFSPKQSACIFTAIVRCSKLLKASLLRMMLFGVLLITPLIIALIYGNRILVTLILPINILAVLLTLLVDHSSQIENGAMALLRDKKLTPIGFSMLLIGNVFQLYSIIKQIQ